MNMLKLLSSSKPRKSGDACSECSRGTLYRVGSRLCCSACTYGWSWHR